MRHATQFTADAAAGINIVLIHCSEIGMNGGIALKARDCIPIDGSSKFAAISGSVAVVS